MTIETSRQQVKRLFDENIYPHIIGDLKILDTIQPETHGNGCSVPTAMLILSSLDFIGYLLNPQGNPDNTEENITVAIEHNNCFPATYTGEVIKNLVIFYRHGIMHSFYPRQTSTKIYSICKSDNHLLLEDVLSEEYNILSLNVNVLSKDFKVFIDKIYQEVLSTSDSGLLESISKGFKVINSESLKTSPIATTQTTIPYGVYSKK